MHLPEEIIWKIILSIIIGGLIGAEREYRSKSAGFRTLTLICVGATLFTVFSQLIGAPGNPDRIASNIVTGIGFVGAGVIFKSDFGVKWHYHSCYDLDNCCSGNGHWRRL